MNDVRLSDRRRRARINAKRTRSTMVLDTLAVVLEIEIEQQLTDKNPRTMLLRDHIRMLAQPTQPGAHGPRFVHHRLNVDTHFSFSTRLLLLDPPVSYTHLRAHE